MYQNQYRFNFIINNRIYNIPLELVDLLGYRRYKDPGQRLKERMVSVEINEMVRKIIEKDGSFTRSMLLKFVNERKLDTLCDFIKNHEYVDIVGEFLTGTTMKMYDEDYEVHHWTFYMDNLILKTIKSTYEDKKSNGDMITFKEFEMELIKSNQQMFDKILEMLHIDPKYNFYKIYSKETENYLYSYKIM